MQAALFCWRRRGGQPTRRGKAISPPQKTERDGDASSTIIRQRSVTRRKSTGERVPEHVGVLLLSIASPLLAPPWRTRNKERRRRAKREDDTKTQRETATQSHRQMKEAIAAISDESIIKDRRGVAIIFRIIIIRKTDI